MAFDSTSLLTLQAAQTRAQTGSQLSTLNALANASPNKNAKLGNDFESMCLSNLLSPMFEGLKSDGPFGGGEGEEAVKSFYIDAMAKQMTNRGGLGISQMMQKQLLKMQEQVQTPVQTPVQTQGASQPNLPMLKPDQA